MLKKILSLHRFMVKVLRFSKPEREAGESPAQYPLL